MKCKNTKPGTGGGIRYLRKSTNENERRIFQSYWIEITNLYGTYIDYWTYQYSLTAQDFLYGEQPLAPFTGPDGLTMLALFQNDSLILAKFGIINDADATFIIPIQTFREKFGNTAEPKAGDLIQMTELGIDRPGGYDDFNTIPIAPITACDQITNPLTLVCQDLLGIAASTVNCNTDSIAYTGYHTTTAFANLVRGAPIFEITERRDQNLTMQYNPLLGHYVWILHAKRFDYSYQPNAPREPGLNQVSDETVYGKLSGGTNWPEEPKKYTDNIDTSSDKEWDYSKKPNNDTSIYGDY